MVRNIYKNEVHLYSLIIPESFEGFSLKKCAAFLTEVDVIRYSKLKVREKKKELLVSRVFLWTVLDRYLAPKTSSMNFFIRNDSNGKPFLFLNNQYVPLYFNISHTKGLISCVVSLHHPLGVDVEYLDRKNVSFIEEYLAPVEREKIMMTQYGDKTSCLYELWTLKEAYLKADGRGLYVPLDSFGFLFGEKQTEDRQIEKKIQIQFYGSINEQQSAEQWFFKLFKPTPRHSLAVAVRMEVAPLLRSFSWGVDVLDSSG